MKLALKIDVDTYRGTRDGVPRLVEELESHSAGATFLFSLGPDNTGKAIRRVFRPGFLRKVRRTSVTRYYGLRTLLSGTVLPAPDIGRKCAAVMRSVRESGYEVGIHAYDHVKWQDHVRSQGSRWTRDEMQKAMERFGEIFGEPARTHGAAGWQMNSTAYRLTREFGFDYASDTRGRHPFIPVCDGEIIGCPQVPTTLPTLDELIGMGEVTEQNVAEHILELTARPSPWGHVFTAHAEMEGGELLPVLDRLLRGWRSQGYEIVSLRTYLSGITHDLPAHEVVQGTVPGRSGMVSMQGNSARSRATGRSMA